MSATGTPCLSAVASRAVNELRADYVFKGGVSRIDRTDPYFSRRASSGNPQFRRK